MADTNMNKNNSSNQTMQHEQAKSSVAGNSRQGEQGQDRDRKPESGQFDKDRQEKSAMGFGQNSEKMSQTGEPGRARNELDDNRTERADSNSRR